MKSFILVYLLQFTNKFLHSVGLVSEYQETNQIRLEINFAKEIFRFGSLTIQFHKKKASNH